LLDTCGGEGLIAGTLAKLLNCETWENTTWGERIDQVNVMIQEVGNDMAAKCMLWMSVRPDYELMFSILAACAWTTNGVIGWSAE
jgi:hypothetical protein